MLGVGSTTTASHLTRTRFGGRATRVVGGALPSIRRDEAEPSTDEPTTSDRTIRTFGAIGWATRGLVYLLTALVIAKITMSDGEESIPATKAGIVHMVEGWRLGSLLLFGLLLGSVAYVAARVLPLFVGRTGPSFLDAARALGAAGLYGWLAISIGRGLASPATSLGPESDDTVAQGDTAWLLSRWWGVLVLVGIAIGIIVYGLWQGRRAMTGHFLERIDRDRSPLNQRWVRRLGVVGFSARAVIAVGIGAFLVVAIVRSDAGEAHGIDGAVRTSLATGLGKVGLVAVAVGLSSFAAYCFVAAFARDHENG